MKRNIKVKRLHKTELLRRILVVLLCINILAGVVSSSLIFTVHSQESSKQNVQHVETREEIKARLMKQIRYEGWDPYSEDMTLDEFYVLMEMFEDGTLPLKNAAYAVNANGQSTVAESSVTVPRNMFLFAGLKDAVENGLITNNTPLEYNNEDSDAVTRDEPDDYPAGLDQYNGGYMRPPKNWEGLEMVGMQAVIIKPGANDGNIAVAGDVVQDLFINYEGYYVSRVTVEGIEAAILGVVQKPDGGFVYYYLSADGQDSSVSTTTMPKGQKFIIQYFPNEHAIDYKVYLNENELFGSWDDLEDFNSFTDITDNVVNLIGYTDTWADTIFGASRPLQTTEGAYSFDVSTPYEYEVRLYRQKGTDIGQYTGKENAANRLKDYGVINDGYPLGAEPMYELSGGYSKLLPNLDKGPSYMTTKATLYNNLVTEDRTVIAVVTRKETPKFDVMKYLPSTNNTSGRGTSALGKIYALDKATGAQVIIPYDYEDLFLWANGGNSKYDYNDNRNSRGDASKNNIRDGNIATGDGWRWNSQYNTVTAEDHGLSNAAMYPAGDGTYYYQWTWQTNNDNVFILDTLEINGVAINIPYSPKKTIDESKMASAKADTGLKGWYAETTLPDGAIVKVEELMAFNLGGKAQRVYRFTITGARTNVTLTNMNLFQSDSGSPEISVYSLEGVYADFSDVQPDLTQSPAIQYFSNNNTWIRGVLAAVLVDNQDEGVKYDGDSNLHGANIRFKLADGYGDPYHLFENPNASGDTVIGNQASAVRNDDYLTATPNSDRIRKLSDVEDGQQLDPQFIYEDDDGWYYIRLTGHDSVTEKFALLTICAVPIRYVVHFIPETSNVPNPGNMPTFEHTIGVCPSFLTGDTTLPMNEYDDFFGSFYDTFKNNIIAIPSDQYGVIQPFDPSGKYIFVDWVLVDETGKPIVSTDGQEFHFFNKAIDLTTIDQYTVYNNELGGESVDVYVIRLKPTWKLLTNPFKYNIVLNWVDAKGELHKEDFRGNWDEVLTEGPVEGESIYVYINKLAEPFWDWIATHPTYTFWDDVNNAADTMDEAGNITKSEDYIDNALTAYISGLLGLDISQTDYSEILAAMTGLAASENGKQIFVRLGSNTFAVNENGGQISFWMYETLGGIVFKKDVQVESFNVNEEYYFTVTDVTVGESHDMLYGTYKAYPKKKFDDVDNDETTDADAWDVTFDNGKIVSIVKNGVDCGGYFTLKHDEEIRLYIPEGTYNIVELGSSSGGSYKVEVEYDGTNPKGENWVLPTGEEWIKGDKQELVEQGTDDGVSQVTAQVDFKIGEHNVVQTIIFHNQTSSLLVVKEIDSLEDYAEEIPPEVFSKTYEFNVRLKLPEGYGPLEAKTKYGETYYYFNMNIYDEHGNGTSGIIILEDEMVNGETVWAGKVQLQAFHRAAIVMTVPEQTERTINYWVEEVEPKYETEGLDSEMYILPYNCEGNIEPAERVVATVVNWYNDLPGNGYLVITEENGDPNESFFYKITNKYGRELIVSVKGGGKTIVYVPNGKYTIEEITDWSWRYEDGVCEQSTGDPNYQTVTVKITNENETPNTAVHADYTHESNDKVWLGGEKSKDNRFAAPSTGDVETENVTLHRDAVTPVIFGDEKRKLL